MTNEEAKQWVLDHMAPDDDTKQSQVMRVVIKALEQQEKFEYEHDHEVVKAYNDGQAFILDKINAEIKETANKIRNIRNDNLCFFTEQDVIDIIDKYRGGTDG